MADNTLKKDPAENVDRTKSGPRSVLRILGLFEALTGGSDELSLAELSAELEAPKSSLLTLLRPLVSEGYLIHNKGRYHLGPRMFRLSADILAVGKFRTLIMPFLEQLSERTHETVFFAVLDPNAKVAVITDVINSPQALRFDLRVGMTFPLYQTAIGSVLLAHQDKKWMDAYLRSVKSQKLKLDEYSPIVPLSRPEALRRVEEARKTGLAVSLSQWAPESGAIAAPVYYGDGSLAGGLTVAGPVNRMQSRLEELSATLKDVAAAASGNQSPASDASSG